MIRDMIYSINTKDIETFKIIKQPALIVSEIRHMKMSAEGNQ